VPGDFLQFGRRLNRKLRPAGSACGRGYPAAVCMSPYRPAEHWQLHNGSIRVGRRAADRRSALAAPHYPNRAYGRRLRAKRAAAERVLSEQRSAAAYERSERRRREYYPSNVRPPSGAAERSDAVAPEAELGATALVRRRPRPTVREAIAAARR
jgi:hypothetical protein